MLNEEREMNRAEHPCYKCKEIPPWKLHIKGRAVRCSSFKLEWGFGGVVRREKTRNKRNQPKKVWGGGGENERGWNKTHTNPLGHREEAARGTSWHKILRPGSPPVFGVQMVTTSYLFGQQGEGAHVGTWRAS